MADASQTGAQAVAAEIVEEPVTEPKSEAEEVPGQSEPEKPEKTHLQKELERIKQGPSDFNEWTALEKLAEGDKDVETVRQVYDGLLAEYPLCYGYWKKYADYEQKHSGPEWATSIFQRGTAAVPYSVDLWGHFATFKQKIGASTEEIRSVFEQGIAYVGTDYLAHGIWDKYIKFETEQGTVENVAGLYRRIMDCPIKELDRYHTSLGTFAAKHQVPELLDQATQDSHRQGIVEAKASSKSETTPVVKAEVKDSVDAVANGDVDMAEAANGLPSAPDAELVAPEAVKPEAVNDEPSSIEEAIADVPVKIEDVTEEEIKTYWLSLCWAAYEESKAELGRRKAFDTAIKRPYYHTKALPHSQLQAWNSYIDYILTKDDAGTIVRLFERCLVPCADHPEFWIRYVRYAEKSDSNNANSILGRAQNLFCRKDLNLYLFAARYQERHANSSQQLSKEFNSKTGDVEAARTSYKAVTDVLAPGLLSAILQAASFERRNNNLEAAKKLFEAALSVESGAEGAADTGASLSIMYARFLFVDCQDSAAARSVLEKALTDHPSLRYLWEAAIHFEEYCLERGQNERVLDLYKRAIKALTDASAISSTDQEILSQQMLDFANRQAAPQVAEKLQAEHDQKFSKYSKTASTKRSAADSGHGQAAKRARQSYTDSHAAAQQPASGALPGPPPMSAPQYAQTAYAAQPQAPMMQQDPYAASQAYPSAYGYDPSYYQYAQAQPQYAAYQYPAYQ